MTDPYKILNISPTASDDEVKRAYRELARKYHPDNYHDNPLADLAQEKMKEINEAYELIQKQRKGNAASAAYGGARPGYSTASGDPTMQKIRLAINRGELLLAEQMLNAVSDHNAEWNFLMGIICYRRGWMDDAKRYFETACQMDPANAEYQGALQRFSNQGYRPGGYSTVSTSSCGGDEMCTRLCYAMICCNLLGGGGCYFLPCFI